MFGFQRFLIILLGLALVAVSSGFKSAAVAVSEATVIASNGESKSGDFIKWVDFNADYGILKKIYDLDVKYHTTDVDFKFAEVLAYLATKNGNKFSAKNDAKNLSTLLERLKNKETVQAIIGENKYYKYYLESYSTIFREFIGEYYTENDVTVKYGLKAYFPFANGFWVRDADDFGNQRSYGFKRKHLGHDMYGGVGTPITAVEGGTVTELGWNKYGGWRVGIMSKDSARYYYYAHLRKDKPFASDLKIGDRVDAGQVIGYLGMTGYSTKENQNLKSGKPHLHIGLQLIFDESQIKGSKEIWIDLYAIIKLLAHNKAQVTKVGNDHKSVNLRYPVDGKFDRLAFALSNAV